MSNASFSVPSIDPSCEPCFGVANLIATVLGSVNVSGTPQSTGSVIGTTSFTFDQFGVIALTSSHTSLTTTSPPLTTSTSLISPSEYIVLSSYSITSNIIVNGTCSTSSGSPVSAGPYSFTVDPSKAGDLNTLSAAQDFFQKIQLTCSVVGANPSPTSLSVPISLLSTTTQLPAPQVTTLSTSSTPRGAATSNASPTSLPESSTSTALGVEGKIGLGIGIPGGVATVVLFTAILWRRRRDRGQKAGRPSEPTPNKKARRRWRAYFQDKGELDAEEQGRNEMEASEIRREIDGRERYELEVEDARQELIGDDLAQELG